MKKIIKLGDCGWSYITENEEAADAIEQVVSELGCGLSTGDYYDLTTEAKEVFDRFAEDHDMWITPDCCLIWDVALQRKADNEGWDYNEDDLELEGYRKWN